MSSLKIKQSSVHSSWYKYFPDVPLTEPRWFEQCSPGLFLKALAIAAAKGKAKFRVRDQENIGKYVSRIIANLKKGATVEPSNTEGNVIEVTVTMKASYQIKEKDKDRFREKVVPSGDCHRWTGAKGSRAYGRFWVNGKNIGAHVFAYFMERGFLPAQGELKGLEVAHACRNAYCCNAKHLNLKTKAANLSERVYQRDAGTSKETPCEGEIIAVHSTTDTVAPTPPPTPSDACFKDGSGDNMMLDPSACKPVSEEQHTDISPPPCLDETAEERAALQQAVDPAITVSCTPPANGSRRFYDIRTLQSDGGSHA